MAAKLKDPLKALAAALEQEQITGVSKKHIQKEVQSLITKVDVLIKYDEIRNQTFLTDSLSEVNVNDVISIFQRPSFPLLDNSSFAIENGVGLPVVLTDKETLLQVLVSLCDEVKSLFQSCKLILSSRAVDSSVEINVVATLGDNEVNLGKARPPEADSQNLFGLQASIIKHLGGALTVSRSSHLIAVCIHLPVTPSIQNSSSSPECKACSSSKADLKARITLLEKENSVLKAKAGLYNDRGLCDDDYVSRIKSAPLLDIHRELLMTQEDVRHSLAEIKWYQQKTQCLEGELKLLRDRDSDSRKELLAITAELAKASSALSHRDLDLRLAGNTRSNN